MSMVDEALRDPISVGMLKTNGTILMQLGEAPGPRVGWILHALLEEVLDDPKKNSDAYLQERARELITLHDDELQKIGRAGKERKKGEEEAEIQQLRKKHHVS
jgi:hypothetical protein